MADEVVVIDVQAKFTDNTSSGMNKAKKSVTDFEEKAKEVDKTLSNTSKKKHSVTMTVEDKASSGIQKVVKNADKVHGKTFKGILSFLDKASSTIQSVTQKVKSFSGKVYKGTLEFLDKATPIVQNVTSKVKTFAGKAWSTTVSVIDKVTSPLKSIFNLLKNPILQAGTVFGISLGIGDVLDTYGTYEATMSKVEAISGATENEMSQISEKAKEMGATTKFTASEAGDAFTYMAMAGWNTQQMLEGIDGIMSLSAADGLDLATTSDIVTDALTAFGLQAKDSAHFADVLATASSSANTNVSMLGESFKYVAPLAGAMNYSVEDISLALGLMANASVKGSMAGTSLKTSIANMAAPTDEMAGIMDKYSISLTDTNGKMKSLKTVIGDLRNKLGRLSEAEQSAAASTLFGKEAMSGMLAIINASDADYKKLVNNLNNADGAAQRMSETMLDNMKGAITLLQSAVDGVKNSFGERLAPYVVKLANWITSKMPQVQTAISKFMDKADEKARELQKTIKEFTSSDEWADSDVWGKLKIAWDKIISEPFSEWWNSKGKQKIIEKVNEIGQSIGKGISTALLTLLGIDVSGTLDAGESIGQSFAKGFAEGFDGEAVGEAIFSAIKKVFSKGAVAFDDFITPGDQEATASDKLAALALGYGGIKLAGGAFKLTKGLYNTGKTAKGAIDVIRGAKAVEDVGAASGTIAKIVGSTGNAMVGGSGLLGKFAGVGYKLRGADAAMYFSGSGMSGGAAAAVGAGAVLGGIVGGATLIKGGYDIYKAVDASKKGDKTEAKARGASGATAIAGVGAGAGIGAAIGSVVPVIGTAAGALIGAGIGGIAGWIGGNKWGESIREDAEAARYESEAMKEAVKDTELSADELAQKFQEAVNTNIAEHFGDMALSMQEISTLAKQIAFGDTTEFKNYSSAVSDAASSLELLQSATDSLNKWNWKIGLGVEFGIDDVESIKSTVEQFISGAKDYVEKKHYEFTASVSLLIDTESKEDSEIITNGNEFYGSLTKKLNEYGSELSEKTEIALKDGVISLDEQKELENLQNQISDITNKIANAENEAELEAIKIKFSGGQINAESFAALQTEIQEQVQESAASYQTALTTSITSLNLQLSEGAINQEEYDAQLEILKNGYKANIDSLNAQVADVQLEILGDAYSDILGDDAKSKLNNALTEAMKTGVNPVQWSAEETAEILGLSSISEESAAAINSFMSQIAASMSKKSLNIDVSSVGTNVSASVGNSIANTDTSPINMAVDSVRTNTENTIKDKFSEPFTASSDIDITLNYRITNPTANIGISGTGVSGSTKVTASVTGHAEGGYVTSRTLSWLAEEGTPEMVIPLGPQRRTRAVSLWEQTGDILGITPKRNALGGIVGSDSNEVDSDNLSYRFAGAGNIEINVGGITFQIDTNGNSDDILAAITVQKNAIVEVIGDALYEALAAQFENRPLSA